MGGRYLSTKISVKHSKTHRSSIRMPMLTDLVTLIGAAAFFIFAVLYAYEALTEAADDVNAI